MRVPSEPSLDMVALLVSVSSYDVFYGAGQDVTVMRESRRERRSIVESVSASIAQITSAKFHHNLRVHFLGTEI